MKECAHKDFMTTNGLSEADLPEPLQKMAKIFGRLKCLLKDAQGKDKEELSHRLEKLDFEILFRILDDLGDQIENNALTDEETDESILEDFVNMIVFKSDLRNAGFRGDLSGRMIRVGNYLLERVSVFFYKFRVWKSPQMDSDQFLA